MMNDDALRDTLTEMGFTVQILRNHTDQTPSWTACNESHPNLAYYVDKPATVDGYNVEILATDNEWTEAGIKFCRVGVSASRGIDLLNWWHGHGELILDRLGSANDF